MMIMFYGAKHDALLTHNAEGEPQVSVVGIYGVMEQGLTDFDAVLIKLVELDEDTSEFTREGWDAMFLPLDTTPTEE